MLEMSNKIKELQYKLAKSYSDVISILNITGSFRDDPRTAITKLIAFNKADGEKLSDVSKMLGNVAERSKTIEIGLKILSSIVTDYVNILTAINVELLNEVKYNATSLDANLKELLSNVNKEVQIGNLGKILVSLATKEYATKRLPIVLEQYLVGNVDVRGYLYGLSLLISRQTTCNIDSLNKALSVYTKKELFIKNELAYIGSDSVTPTTDVVLETSTIDTDKTLEVDLNKYIIEADTETPILDVLNTVVTDDINGVEVISICTSYVKDTLDKITNVTNNGVSIVASDIIKLSTDLSNSVLTDKEFNKQVIQYSNIFKSSLNNYTELLDTVDSVSTSTTLSLHVINTVYNVCNDVLINITVG